MRFPFLVLSLALMGVASASNADTSSEFQDVVNYLNSQMSSEDIIEMVDILPESLDSDEQDLEVMQRSVGTIVGNAVDRIPWNKIVDNVKNMAKKNPKFNKVLNLLNDSKFRELVSKSVNSHTLGEFVMDVSKHGFSWTQFLHLLLHALCSASNTLQHDRYTVSVCQVLQNV